MGKILKYGLIGYPVSHSHSPSMHNAAFKHLKLNAAYQLYEVKPEKLEEFLKVFPERLSGSNVTIPHKIAARNFIEKNGILSENARKIGAVNTIIVKDSKLVGDNTDGAGFMESLKRDLSFDPKNKIVCLIGAGGAARSIVMQLGNLPKKIYVIDIVQKQLEELKKNYNSYYEKKILEIHLISEINDRTQIVKECELFVNATPVGMEHMPGCVIEKEALHEKLAVFDVIYNPRKTQLIKWAEEAGLKQVMNGEGMLLYQGAISFKLWTGLEAPVDTMRKALEASLSQELH